MDSRNVIARLARLEPSREWVEPLVRSLGCACPDEVFASISRSDLSTEGAELGIDVGRRLLLAFVPAERLVEAYEILARCRVRRDADGLHRCRLVVVGAPDRGVLDRIASRVARELDERAHVHGVSVDAIEVFVGTCEDEGEPSAPVSADEGPTRG